jgi:hypothetical protein
MGHANRVNKMDLYLGMIIFGVSVIVLSMCMPALDALIQYLEGLRDQTKNAPDKHQN